MNKTELKLEYILCEEQKGGIPVVIVAAGSFRRMNGINKQMLELGGIPVIIRTLQAFENSNAVGNIILVVREEDVFDLQLLTEKYNITKLTDIVSGGETREHSVLRGIERISESADAVLIHDGARPLVDKSIIESVANALKDYPAVTCAVSVKDTVKIVNSDGVVVKTLPRENLKAVQTPQGVRLKEYREAIEKVGDVSAFTDDTSIMETAGFKVKCVEGSYRNIKITTPDDIETAQAFLEAEE